jgi:hypothetical protein
MHSSTVSQIENARMLPYPTQLAKLAAALGWTREPGALLDEVDREPAA